MTAAGVPLFCVDGTNLVRGLFGYAGPDFRAQEDADSRRLVEGLGQLCQAAAGRLEIEVFFDGEPRAGLVCRVPGLTVRFTREVEADAVILDRVSARRYGHAGKTVVVTGDAELGEDAAAEGGRWLRVKRGAPFETIVSAIEGRFLR